MTTLSAPEVRLALLEMGLPVMTYEASHADVRDFDTARVQARVDAFMESQGLRKLSS